MLALWQTETLICRFRTLAILSVVVAFAPPAVAQKLDSTWRLRKATLK